MKKKKKIFWNKRSGKMLSSAEIKTRKLSRKKEDGIGEAEKDPKNTIEQHKIFAKKFSQSIKKAARGGQGEQTKEDV